MLLQRVRLLQDLALLLQSFVLTGLDSRRLDLAGLVFQEIAPVSGVLPGQRLELPSFLLHQCDLGCQVGALLQQVRVAVKDVQLALRIQQREVLHLAVDVHQALAEPAQQGHGDRFPVGARDRPAL